jgi:hypothetical protein
MPQLAGPPGGVEEHVPSVLPLPTEHVPVQQSAAVAQASPACPQKDDAWHAPLTQSPEQQCALDVHALPRVAQLGLSAAHLPPMQLWPQQSLFTLQPKPSDVHAGYAHIPRLQSPPQQSPFVAQAEPNLRQPAPPAPVKTSGSSDPSPARRPPEAPSVVASVPASADNVEAPPPQAAAM